MRFPYPVSVTETKVAEVASETTSIPIMQSSPSSIIPRTPRAVRPIARASDSLNRIDLPLRLAIRISMEPSVRRAAIRLSPSSIVSAMMPPWRGFEYAIRSVFFTVPFWVAVIIYLSSSNSLTGRIVITFSSSCRLSRLTIALPRAARPPCGISCTLSQ